MNHRHTPGPLKQSNKKHKSSSGKSKRSIKLSHGGKIDRKEANTNKSHGTNIIKYNYFCSIFKFRL